LLLVKLLLKIVIKLYLHLIHFNIRENKKIKKNFRGKEKKIYGGIYKILTGWNKGRYHHIINWKKYDEIFEIYTTNFKNN